MCEVPKPVYLNAVPPQVQFITLPFGKNDKELRRGMGRTREPHAVQSRDNFSWHHLAKEREIAHASGQNYVVPCEPLGVEGSILGDVLPGGTFWSLQEWIMGMLGLFHLKLRKLGPHLPVCCSEMGSCLGAGDQILIFPACPSSSCSSCFFFFSPALCCCRVRFILRAYACGCSMAVVQLTYGVEWGMWGLPVNLLTFCTVSGDLENKAINCLAWSLFKYNSNVA